MKIGVLKNFANFTGKHLFFKNTYFEEQLRQLLLHFSSNPEDKSVNFYLENLAKFQSLTVDK